MSNSARLTMCRGSWARLITHVSCIHLITLSYHMECLDSAFLLVLCISNGMNNTLIFKRLRTTKGHNPQVCYALSLPRFTKVASSDPEIDQCGYLAQALWRRTQPCESTQRPWYAKEWSGGRIRYYMLPVPPRSLFSLLSLNVNRDIVYTVDRR